MVSAQGTESIGLSGNGENPATDTVSPTSLVFPVTTGKYDQRSADDHSDEQRRSSVDGHSSADVRRFPGDQWMRRLVERSIRMHHHRASTAPHATGTEIGSVTITDSVGSQIVSLSGTGHSTSDGHVVANVADFSCDAGRAECADTDSNADEFRRRNFDATEHSVRSAPDSVKAIIVAARLRRNLPAPSPSAFKPRLLDQCNRTNCRCRFDPIPNCSLSAYWSDSHRR